MIVNFDLQQSFLWLPLIGFLIGMLATITGSGGGLFFPIVLIVFFHIPAQIAVATSLAAGVPLSLTGTIGHYRKGNIELQTGFIFGMAGIAGALFGALVTLIINPEELKSAFGVYAIILAIIISATTDKKMKPPKDSHGSGYGKKRMGFAFGFAGGIISGTFGTSGSAPVMAGLFSLRLPVKRVIGTSLMVVLINTIAAFASHFLIGEIDMTLVFLLTLGSVAGAITGPYMLAGIETEKYEKSIRYIFGLAMLFFGFIILYQSL